LFWYFEVLEFSIFFLSFWGTSVFCVKIHKGGEWIFAFLLVNFQGFLFWNFEVLKSSIFIFIILGDLNFA
jgi:hypothetical protein